MKQTVFNLIKFLVFMTVFILLLLFTSNIFIPNWKIDKQEGQTYITKGFYSEKKNTLDVLFVGSSNMYRGITPMTLYDKYGITSYTFGNASARAWNIYYSLSSALEYQKPEVVFIDCATLLYQDVENEGNRRKSLDNMPFSYSKIKALSDKEMVSDEFEVLSYIFPIFRYHDRWKNLNFGDFDKLNKEYKFMTRGYVYADRWKNFTDSASGYMNKTKNKKGINEKTLKYLYKIEDLAKKYDFDIVYVGIIDSKKWNHENSLYVSEYASSVNRPFIDFNTIDIGYDWSTDSIDGVHSNIFGANKMTNYIGEYLNNNYKLPNHKNDPKYSRWDSDLIDYNFRIKKSYLKLENAKKKQNDKVNVLDKNKTLKKEIIKK